MQLNVHVPREKVSIVEALDRTAARLGRKKNEIVLEALEAYLREADSELQVFHLGPVEPIRRSDLYLDRPSR